MQVAAHTSGPDRAEVIEEMKTVSTASDKLLLAAKEIACDLTNATHRQNLSAAAKGYEKRSLSLFSGPNQKISKINLKLISIIFKF